MDTDTFALDIRKFKDKLENRTRVVLQKTALDIDKGVVLSTPVDTGQARGGWNVGINNVNLSETGQDKSGRKTILENERTIQSADGQDTVFISNNVGHITYLEKGKPGPGSDQAPNGMVAKTLRRFHNIVKQGVIVAKREHP